MDSLAEQIFIDVIKGEMALNDTQAWIRSQNVKIPTDSGLYVIVGMVDAPRVMSSVRFTKETSDDPPQLLQCQQIVMRENIQIDIFSRDNSAILRRWEIIAALTSYRAAQAMEANSFKIFRTPTTFVNTSGGEGGSTINRFTLIVPCHVWYYKENALPTYDYYDEFGNRVDDANTIATVDPLIEFTIDENTVINYNS